MLPQQDAAGHFVLWSFVNLNIVHSPIDRTFLHHVAYKAHKCQKCNLDLPHVRAVLHQICMYVWPDQLI